MIYTTILIPILWVIFALASGYTEAGYWYYKYNGKAIFKPKYEHTIWTVMRFILGLSFTYIYFTFFGWWAIFGGVGLMALFPFFHDGMYYYQRNKYDGSYPEGFKDTSHNSTAKTPTLNYYTRLICATWVFIILELALILN